jgi:hypothetical protein
VVRYPNEETKDFEEIKKIAQILKGYLDAPQLCELRVMYGSHIQRNPEQFNIKQLEHTSIDLIMYPSEYLEKGFAFVYSFKQRNPTQDQPWEALVEGWKKEQETRKLEEITQQTTIDQLVFYFVDGGSFIKIYDKRDRQNIRIFVLNELERAVFLSCVDIISIRELQKRFIDVPEYELIAILQSFEQNRLLFAEDDHYLCLPLRCHIHNTSEKNVECLVNISP